MSSAGDILCRFKITPTAQRVALLNIALTLEKRPFTVQDVSARIHTMGCVVSHNTVVTTLQLFVSRKVLRALPAPKNGKRRGRPSMLYFVDVTLESAGCGTQTLPPPDESESVKGMDFSFTQE